MPNHHRGSVNSSSENIQEVRRAASEHAHAHAIFIRERALKESKTNVKCDRTYVYLYLRLSLWFPCHTFYMQMRAGTHISPQAALIKQFIIEVQDQNKREY